MVNHDFEGDSSRYKNSEREEKKKEELCVQAMVCLNSTKNQYQYLFMSQAAIA